MMSAHVRPCVKVTAQRVSSYPLRRNPLFRLLGANTAEPRLDVTESKFGGIPYSESGENWEGHHFLGQIDLAEATAVLPPNSTKLRGLLRIDQAVSIAMDLLRVRWFPEVDPTQARAPTVPAVSSVGAWETRLRFELGWTLPEGALLEKLWPLSEPAWFEYDVFYPDGYNADGFDGFHRMLGHKPCGLDEHYGFTPPAGGTEDIAEYENLLRITFDNEAGFHWGTNWVYLIVPRRDLHRGDLTRVVVTGANS